MRNIYSEEGLLLAIELDDARRVAPLTPSDPGWNNWYAWQQALPVEDRIDITYLQEECRNEITRRLDVWFAGLQFTHDTWNCDLTQDTRNAWTSQLLALQVLTSINPTASLPLRFGPVVTPAYTMLEAATIALAYMSRVNAAISTYYTASQAIMTAGNIDELMLMTDTGWSALLGS